MTIEQLTKQCGYRSNRRGPAGHTTDHTFSCTSHTIATAATIIAAGGETCTVIFERFSIQTNNLIKIVHALGLYTEGFSGHSEFDASDSITFSLLD